MLSYSNKILPNFPGNILNAPKFVPFVNIADTSESFCGGPKYKAWSYQQNIAASKYYYYTALKGTMNKLY